MSVPVRRRSVAVIGVAAAALLLAACSSSSDSGGSSAAPSSTNTDPACAAYTQYGSFPSGTKVTLLTSILPPEQQQYEKSWADFEKCTGIDVVYEGTDQFEALIPTRIAGGNAPDIAFIPQPGLLKKLVQGDSGPLEAPQAVKDNITKYWSQSIAAYGSVDNTVYAAPLSTNMKSFVWYSPKVFTAKGYKVPTTWDEMFQLSDQMVKDGIKPWCGGIESGGATGWLGTDWIEQLVLRQQGIQTYQDWVAHTVLFNSPQIKQAFDTLDKWYRNNTYANAGFGDTKTIATTAFQDGGKPILSGKCGMYQQASFYGAQWKSFKADVTVSDSGDVFAFYLPAINADVKTPIVFGGEYVAAFKNTPEVVAFQTYLTTPEWATGKVKLGGGWVSANNGVDINSYPEPTTQLAFKYLTDPNATAGFDASDQMPAQVGAGSFWKGMTAWFGENKSTDAVVTAIDASWPS